MIKSTVNDNLVTVMPHRYDDNEDSGDRFWVEDPLALLTDFTLIPRAKMSLEQKMNVITRIVIIVWILLLVVKYRHATVFFLATLLVIVLIYYSRKRHEERIERILKRLDRNEDRYETRTENPNSVQASQPPNKESTDGGFTRFEALAGNKMTETLEAVTARPATFAAKNHDERSVQEHRRLKEALKLKKTTKRQEKIQRQQFNLQKAEEKEMRKKNQQEELVRSQQPPKRDPRRPWPPTVPFSMEVHSGHGEISQEAAHVPQPHLKHPENHFQDKNEQPRQADRHQLEHNGHTYDGKRDVKSANQLDEQRQLNLRRSQLGGPRPQADSKFHGYHAEAFHDESGEESDNDSASDSYERQEVEIGCPVVVVDVKPVTPPIIKRTFLPSNYDAAQDKTPVVRNEGPKMTRHGAARARRVPKWGDNNDIKPLHDASDMQFTRAAKLEQKIDSKGRNNRERQSQVHSLFG